MYAYIYSYYIIKYVYLCYVAIYIYVYILINRPWTLFYFFFAFYEWILNSVWQIECNMLWVCMKTTKNER